MWELHVRIPAAGHGRGFRTDQCRFSARGPSAGVGGDYLGGSTALMGGCWEPGGPDAWSQ